MTSLITSSCDVGTALWRGYVQVAERVYADDPWLSPPPSDSLGDSLKAALDPGRPYFQHASCRHFVCRRGDTVVARCTAFIDAQLSEVRGTTAGSIGLFEADNDAEAVRSVIDTACDWLRQQGVTTVIGPVNFSIWYGYRFRTGGFDQPPYLGEPYNPSYYPQLFEAAGFAPSSFYVGLDLREQDIAAVENKRKPAHQGAVEAGFTFRTFNAEAPDEEVANLHRLLIPSYEDASGWTDLAYAEFAALISDNVAQGLYRHSVFIDDEHGELAGFIVTVPDLLGQQRPTEAGHEAAGARRIHFAHIVVSPEFRRAGIGGALAYETHRSAREAGYQVAIYGPHRTDNVSNNYYGGMETTKKYTLYERLMK